MIEISDFLFSRCTLSAIIVIRLAHDGIAR